MKRKHESGKTLIYGRHAIEEALTKRPDVVEEVHLGHGEMDQELKKLAKAANVPVRVFEKKTLPKDVAGNVHQGMFAKVATKKLMQDYNEFAESLGEVDAKTSVLLLGEIEDPQNVGAIIRSAVAFGVSAILVPPHHQAQINGTVVKVSAGMAFSIPLVQIGNVNNTIEDLKKRGFWIYGLAGEGATPVYNEEFTAPSVFVLGNEAKGIREKTRENVDILLSIPIAEECESLNVAHAGSIVMYEWRRQQAK